MQSSIGTRVSARGSLILKLTFKAEGTGVNFTGLINPLTLVLTIGVNTGTTTVTAQFE